MPTLAHARNQCQTTMRSTTCADRRHDLRFQVHCISIHIPAQIPAPRHATLARSRNEANLPVPGFQLNRNRKPRADRTLIAPSCTIFVSISYQHVNFHSTPIHTWLSQTTGCILKRSLTSWRARRHRGLPAGLGPVSQIVDFFDLFIFQRGVQRYWAY